MSKKHLIYATFIALVPALFIIPRSVNNLLAQSSTTTTPTASCAPVYYGTSTVNNPSTTPQPSTQRTSIYPLTNPGTSVSTTTTVSGADDPNFAQKEFDAYYASKYPNYRQHEVTPTQTTPYTAAQGYGYLTNNPASIDDPNFAQKEFDSFYAQKYPNYTKTISSAPSLGTQPSTPFPFAR